MVLTDYKTEWDGEAVPIQIAILRIENGVFPDRLRIRHPRDGTFEVSPGLFGANYSAESSPGAAPVQPVGMGFGLHRTYASGTNVAPLNRDRLLNRIHDEFPNLANDIAEFRDRLRGKTLRLQREAMRRTMNNLERATDRNLPVVRELGGQFFGEATPIPGAFSVKENFSKINTNLFRGGKKKRKQTKRKGRKGRKQTRRTGH